VVIRRDEEQVQVIVKVPESLRDTFRAACESNYKSVSEVVRAFMVEYIRKNEGKEQREGHIW